MSNDKKQDAEQIDLSIKNNLKILETLKNKKIDSIDDINLMFDDEGKLLQDLNFHILVKSYIDNNIIEDYKDPMEDLLQKDFLDRFKRYIKRLKDRLKADISKLSLDEIKEIVKSNNTDYIYTYLYLNANCYDLLDNNIKKRYITYLTNSITQVQINNIKSFIALHNLTMEDFLNKVDIKTTSFIKVISLQDLENIQNIVRDADKNNAFTEFKSNLVVEQLNKSDMVVNTIQTDTSDDRLFNFLNSAIFDLTYLRQEDIINFRLKRDADYYKNIHKYYKQVEKLLYQLRDKYNEYLKVSDDIDNLTLPIRDKKSKPIPLIASKLFNGNVVQLNKEFNLNSVNGDRHKDPINITINIDEDKLNDFGSLPILADLGQQNKIALLPIDLPLFISFTKLNSVNGGNEPITLEDAFNDIVENKDVRLRKSNKSYDIYQDRLLYLDRLNMTFNIVDAKTKANIYTLKDPTPLLANSRVLLKSNKKLAYIIGASSIITLIKAINKIYGVDFLASYNIDKQYINDNQDNTIEILNMKYYLLPKILQYGNSKKRLDTAQNKINLDDLYTSTAILKGKNELSKKDKETLKNQINTYLNHLNKKGLISDYSYASDKTQNLSIDVLKGTKQRDIKYLKIK